jgi:hypothetical protein
VIAAFAPGVVPLPQGVRKVYLMKQGEPFINNKLEDMMRYLRMKRPDIYIALHTNGVIAERKRVKDILPFLNALGISVSAITKRTYNKVHGKDSFERVMRNLEGISDSAISLPKGQRPHIFIDYVQQQKNRNESRESVVRFYKENFAGLSSVDFHWVYNFQGEVEEGNLEIYDRLPEDKFPRCVFPWCSITFCHDGLVSYCFVEPRENNFLGDISKQSFREIWNGSKYTNFRRMMAGKEFNKLKEHGYFCRQCSWLWSMKSQSPKNLCCGYSMENKEISNGHALGDILELPLKESLDIAMETFLSGEIHKALGIVDYIIQIANDKNLLKKARQLKSYCKQILSLYKELPLWLSELEREGISLESRRCYYYKIND